MRIHIVGRGETLLRIGEKTGLSAVRLAEENGLPSSARLTEGQSLLYTRPARLHTIRAGETAADICRAEGLSLRRLMRQNPALEAGERLPTGQEITVTQAAVPFGPLSVFGLFPARAEAEVCAASLPYLTALLCEGCRLTGSGLSVPSSVRRLRRLDTALRPSLWAMADTDSLAAFAGAGGAERVAAMLCEAGFGGLCIVGGNRIPRCGNGYLPSASPQRTERSVRTPDGAVGAGIPGTTEAERRAAECRAVLAAAERLREAMTDAGLGVCTILPEDAITGEEGTLPCPVLLQGSEGEGLAAVCRRLGATESIARRRMLWPRLTDTAVCTSILPDGARRRDLTDLSEIPDLLTRCRPTVRREADGAFVSYRTRAGRQAIRHDLRFEDAYSLSEGLYGMNRCGLCGVWCDATRVPLWMLYMLSVCYEIVDPCVCK